LSAIEHLAVTIWRLFSAAESTSVLQRNKDSFLREKKFFWI